MQELVVYYGQLECYAQCPEILEKTIGVKIGHSQIHRICDFYGNELSPTIAEARTLAPLQPSEVLYAELDGSMLFTRDEGWREVKVGRIFKSGDCTHLNEDTNWIRHSQYLAYMGNCKLFGNKMEGLIESYGSLKQRLIFINDGAIWIRQWIEDTFPDAISILDFWHALEYLHDFANSFFKDKTKSTKWIEKQKTLLLNSKTEQVIRNITRLDSANEQAKKTINYYQTNLDRMDYKYYRTIGSGIIGSGAIESAHRTVVQKRMKLSGQRWSIKGAQNMLNLRVTYMNERWDNVIRMVKTDLKKQHLGLTG